MKNPKFQVFKSVLNNQYYYNLRSANGEKVLSGEGYTSKQGCLNGINAVKTNAPIDSRYDRKNFPNYMFNLKAANGEIIGKSETYTNPYGRENGILAVKKMRLVRP